MPAVSEELRASFKLAMRRFPAAVSVITSADQSRRHGMTATAVTSLSLDPPSRSSVRNVLPGVIRGLKRGAGPYASATVDVGGAVLKAELTRRAVDELGLAPGKVVHATVKSVAVSRA